MAQNMFKVLCVDDTEDNIDILENILGEDYQLITAMDGQTALDMVASEMPDIIFLDVMMPNMNGYEVCTRLKANPLTKDIPVIFLTGKSEVDDETKGLEIGAVDYITKPISVPILLARLKTHLQLKSEKNKSDDLIKNILPHAVAEELKTTGKTVPVCFEKGAVMFSDLVGFTRISSKMTANELIGELNDLFTAYDDIIDKYDCERIKTIGDAYMAVSGLPVPSDTYADNIVLSAVEILSHLKARQASSSYQWTATIGIDSGEVVGGVVGVKKFIYDIFGSTVNMASRLQSAAKIYQTEIMISGSIYDDMKQPENFCLREIDLVRVKGEDEIIRLFEVFDCDEPSLKQKKKATLDTFSEGVLHYRLGEFVDALEKFKQCQEQCPEDPLPLVYIKRCSTLARMPLSPDWAGVSGI